MTDKTPALILAHRHCNALRAAIAAGKHNCWCGVFGPFRMHRGAPWLCRQHIAFGPDGSFEPIPQS